MDLKEKHKFLLEKLIAIGKDHTWRFVPLGNNATNKLKKEISKIEQLDEYVNFSDLERWLEFIEFNLKEINNLAFTCFGYKDEIYDHVVEIIAKIIFVSGEPSLVIRDCHTNEGGYPQYPDLLPLKKNSEDNTTSWNAFFKEYKDEDNFSMEWRLYKHLEYS